MGLNPSTPSVLDRVLGNRRVEGQRVEDLSQAQLTNVWRISGLQTLRLVVFNWQASRYRAVARSG
jgi:hypothetical protein